MEGRTQALREKLERLVREAAQAAVELDRAAGTIVGVPHYSVIEARAHELGRQLSREVQAQQMTEVAVQRTPQAACPKCGTRCQLSTQRRTVTSIDGPLEVQESVGKCAVCRKFFFPGSRGPGV